MSYGMKDAANVTIVKRGTHEPVLFADYANTTSVEWKADRVYAKKKGANAIAWDANRTGELTIETELFDLKLMALIAGDDDLHKGQNDIFKREAFTLTSDRLIKLSNTPISGSISVFKLGDDGLTHEMTIPQLVDGSAASVPTMVTDVAVTPHDKTAVIMWSASTGATSYVVLRDGVKVGEPVGTTYTDADLTPNKQYKYTVVAVNNNGSAPKSAEVVITTTAEGASAGEAVHATEQAKKDAEKNAAVVSANGLNFKVTDHGGIQLSDAAVVGARYAVYYMTKMDGVSSYTINAQKFADNFEIYADCFIRDKEKGQDHLAQMHYMNAKPEGSFTFSQNSKEPTSLSIKFDLLPDENNNMATYKYIED